MNFLNFGSQFGNPDVAGAYFLCALAACIGTLQIIAARYGYIGLAWLRPRWQPTGGVGLGVTLIVIGCALFFNRHAEGIFRPGPAGLELFLLFGAALALSLPLTLTGAALVQASAARRGLPRAGAILVEAVDLPSGTGWLYRPLGETVARPAVCAVGTPGAGPEAVARLATALAEAGVVALAVGWNETDQWRPNELEALATAVSAAAFLREMREVDANRLGAAGVGLGGDVALQVAAVDDRIRAVVAVAPWLDLKHAEPGLSLLREMTLPQAWRWQRALRQSAQRLDPLAHAPQLHPRPVLLVQPDDLGPSEGARRTLAHLCRHLTTLPVPYLGQSRDASRQIADWMSVQLAV
jgi:hypothetical protein